MSIDELFEEGIEVFNLWVAIQLHDLEDSHEDSLEAFEVPVLIDDLVDDSGLEDLVCLLGEQVHKVVHVVDRLSVLHLLSAPLGQ